MKVIDLLNKIANGEIPEKIKYKETLYSYTKDIDYESENDNFLFDDRICICPEDLNDEVEIIEDKPISKLYVNNELQYDLAPKEDKKIEKLDISGLCNTEITLKYFHKINEIIDRINGE